jgi:predicted nucleic acid-binding protein
MSDSENKKLNIYLDNCCYNRPYDDQTQLRIELETKAKLFIQNLIVVGKVDLTTSSLSVLENKKNPYSDRRFSIQDFFRYSQRTATSSAECFAEAENLKAKGLKTYDAIHLSFAILSACDYFITTDDRLLKCQDDRIQIIDPQNFMRIWEEQENDE